MFKSNVYRGERMPDNKTLSESDKRLLLELARNTIKARLMGLNQVDIVPESDVLREPRGAFVTLHKNGQLRGCIGYVEPIKPLYQAVIDMAIAAAFQDPRFPPLKMEEFNDISIEISAMSPLKKIKDISEVQVGVHGILIKRGFYQGLLLPQVATEQGWDRDTFLEHTCYKAGMGPDCWKHPDTEIYIFSAEVFSEEDFKR